MSRSWGRVPKTTEEARPMRFASDAPAWPDDGRCALAHGLGRSYGDVALNDGGVLFMTPRMDRLLALDETTGVLRCEAGASLAEILQVFAPRGWFLPVTPGTKFVTVGGAIANDVHGKNHHRAGTFGRHVVRFELARSDGKRLVCSPSENADFFAATIGGLGLTGVITWAEFRLVRIPSVWLDTETIRTRDLESFFRVSDASAKTHDFSFTWIDSTARGRSLGRGLFLHGNWAPSGPPKAVAPREIPAATDAPAVAVNGLFVAAFNALYYRQPARAKRMHYDPFFYPLDAIHRWSRPYGSRGFYQYQCVVPREDGDETLRAILDESARAKQASFLTVLKAFGDLPSPGMLSFPQPGVTVALDFPNRGAKTLDLLERLDVLTRRAGGRVYPGKDARMSRESFQAYYPRWKEFSAFIDPKISSSFWRRVAG